MTITLNRWLISTLIRLRILERKAPSGHTLAARFELTSFLWSILQTICAIIFSWYVTNLAIDHGFNLGRVFPKGEHSNWFLQGNDFCVNLLILLAIFFGQVLKFCKVEVSKEESLYRFGKMYPSLKYFMLGLICVLLLRYQFVDTSTDPKGLVTSQTFALWWIFFASILYLGIDSKA